MKFKNILQKPIMLKLEKGWVSVEPECFIDLPKRVGDREKGLIFVEEVKVKKEVLEKKEKPIKNLKKLSELELKKLTKDGLNDYAVTIGLKDDINYSMKKAEMIKTILKYQK